MKMSFVFDHICPRIFSEALVRVQKSSVCFTHCSSAEGGQEQGFDLLCLTPTPPQNRLFYLTPLTVLLSPLFNSHSVRVFSSLPLTARIARLALVDGLSFTLARRTHTSVVRLGLALPGGDSSLCI